jgi:signal transduction histidine kinase
MRSVYAKVLISSFGVLAFSYLLFLVIARSNISRSFQNGAAFAGLLDVQADEAQRAYLESGPRGLASYLSSVASHYPGTRRYFLDRAGRDVLTSTDRSKEWGEARSGWNRFALFQPVYIAQPTKGQNYILLFVPSTNMMLNIQLYYALLLVAVLLLGWLLAFQFVSPLNRLAEAVRRFGAGNLSTRVDSARRDELGDLARSFNQMAERIETLLTAERRLLQDISHELRSPLARLSFATELARTSGDREAAMARVDKEVRRLSELIESLIHVTRAEGDSSARNLQTVVLGPMIAELVEDAKIEADSRQCRFLLSGSNDLVLHADRELLRRALENIERNAIRHAPAGSTVESAFNNSPANACISVRDYGPGVPAEALTAIFRPFFRVDSSRDTSTGGIGLGLAIAERAIRVHHGKVWAENAHPGLRVCVDLPIARPAPA